MFSFAFLRDSQANSDDSVSSQSSISGGLYHSHSNPDLSSTGGYEDIRAEFPEHVLKVCILGELIELLFMWWPPGVIGNCRLFSVFFNKVFIIKYLVLSS